MTSSALKILLPPFNDFSSKPSAVQPSKDLVLAKGKDKSVRCQATSRMQPRMNWSKSGGDLPAGRALVLADGTLKLTNIQLEDAGEYVCNASVGKFEFTVGKMQLIVHGNPMIPTHLVTGASVSHLYKIEMRYFVMIRVGLNWEYRLARDLCRGSPTREIPNPEWNICVLVSLY